MCRCQATDDFFPSFQLSWRLWKKMLYAFWLVVIGFSMLTLILVYTYQFNRIEEYLDKLLNIDIELYVKLILNARRANHFNLIFLFRSTDNTTSVWSNTKPNRCSSIYSFRHFWLSSPSFNCKYSTKNSWSIWNYHRW